MNAPDIGRFSPVKVQEVLVHHGPPDTDVGEPQYMTPFEYARRMGMSYDPNHRHYTTEGFDGSGCVHEWRPVEFQPNGMPVFAKGYKCAWCTHRTKNTCTCALCQREEAGE
jgi:hypothetical protein